MEFVDGKALNELIPEGGMPLDRLLRIAIPLADAVGAAHQRGILHRDLKPANVMLTADGRVKVLDFGLARLQDDIAAREPLETQELTGEGRIVGTVAYMSPEQAEAKVVDQRSDGFQSACCYTSWRPAAGRSRATAASPCSRPSSGRRLVPYPSSSRSCRAISHGSSGAPSTRIPRSVTNQRRISATT